MDPKTSALWAELRASVPDSVARQLARLKDELSGAIARCVFTGVHEGHRHPYGVVVARHEPDLDGRATILQSPPENPLPLLVDGHETMELVVRGQPPRIVRLATPLGTYSAVVDLACAVEGLIVASDEDGVLQIVSPDWGITVADRTWTIRESTFKYTERVTWLAPAADREAIGALIELAHYSLSPRHIGATLLYALEEPSPESPSRSHGHVVESLGLRATDARDLPLIQHQLKFTDGAAIFARDGRMLRTGVMLTPTPQSKKAVGDLSGARHTSAARHSFDEPGILSLVVSEDGPVTLFSDGEMIAQLPVLSLRDEIKSWDIKGVDVDAWGYADTVQCPTCHVSLLTKTVIVPGYRYEETASCPVCSTQVARDMCMEINVVLRKSPENIAALRAFRSTH